MSPLEDSYDTVTPLMLDYKDIITPLSISPNSISNSYNYDKKPQIKLELDNDLLKNYEVSDQKNYEVSDNILNDAKHFRQELDHYKDDLEFRYNSENRLNGRIDEPRFETRLNDRFNHENKFTENKQSQSQVQTNEKYKSYSDESDYEPKKKMNYNKKRLNENQKKAHNKIEKKYRINLNQKIANLQQVIPGVSMKKAAFETNLPCIVATNEVKLNKSVILEMATNYIKQLNNQEQQNILLIKNLKNEIKKLGGDPNVFQNK